MAAYIFAQLEITDPAAYDEYRRHVGATITQYGGRFVVRGTNYEVLEGSDPKRRLVLVEFDDMAAAKRWYRSPEYAPLIPMRQKAARGTVLLVEGA